MTGRRQSGQIRVPLAPVCPLLLALVVQLRRFTQWFGENVNRNSENGTFTFSITGRAVDGSDRIRFHEVAHVTINKKGTVVEFDKTSC